MERTTLDTITNYDLWETYVDPGGYDTPESFAAHSITARLQMFLERGFEADETVSDLLRIPMLERDLAAIGNLPAIARQADGEASIAQCIERALDKVDIARVKAEREIIEIRKLLPKAVQS